MRVSVVRVGVAVVATPLVFGACRGDRQRSDTLRGGMRNAGILNRDSTRKLGPDDIRIVSTDSTIEVALVGDSVITGLAEKALAKLKVSMDTGAVTGTGLGAKLEKFVKSSVQSALNKQLTFPLSSVSDVRFNAGKLEFFDNAGKRMAVFGGSGTASNSHGGTFSESDAQAFTAVFRAKKAPPR